MNADRFSLDPGERTSPAAIGALAAWSQWWDSARTCPALSGAFHERDHRPSLGTGNSLTADEHVQLLHAVRFRSVELTRLSDRDAVVVATR